MKQGTTVDDIMIKNVKSIEIPGSRDEILSLMQKRAHIRGTRRKRGDAAGHRDPH